MGTIVQEYGPIYGEVVNGTVSGRPNGSVYVPHENTITLTIPDSHKFVRNAPTVIRCCKSNGSTTYVVGGGYNYTAVAQDLASNVQLQLFSDSDCTNLIASRNMVAGKFNSWGRDLYGEETIVNGTTYYARVQLMNNSTAIATSEVIEVTGWAEE